MEKVDYSTNSKRINDIYTKVVRGDAQVSYGVFTVDKRNVLDVTASGAGALTNFVEEFTDGSVQFGLARVTVPGSDVHKNILLGWCPDNAPAKLRLSFAPTFVDISKIFSGYHVQITARDYDDLDVDEMFSKVGAAAGARYTYQAEGSSGIGSAPTKHDKTYTSKPALNRSPIKIISEQSKSKDIPFTKTSSAQIGFPHTNSSVDDGWGDEKAIEERDLDIHPLEDVPSAYKPTKVNIEELRSQKSDSVSSQASNFHSAEREASSHKIEEPKLLGERLRSFESNDSERLTSLPKPKVSLAVSSRYSAAAVNDSSASKPVFGSKPLSSVSSSRKDLPEGVFQNYANENGLSPAQAWAQKRGKYYVDPSNKEGEIAQGVSKVFLSKAQDEILEPAASTSNSRETPSVEGQDFTKPVLKSPPFVNTNSLPPKFVAPQEVRDVDSITSTSPEVKLADADDKTEPQKDMQSSQTQSESAVPKVSQEQTVSAVAQYDYEKDEDNEVSFKEGDIIVDIEFVDEEWWAGKNSRTGDSGVFPGSYVTLSDSSEHTIDSVAHAQPVESSGKSAIAEYDYEKEEDNELGFSEGDLIVDIEFVDEDWWSGKHSVTGEEGVFPGNFVALQ